MFDIIQWIIWFLSMRESVSAFMFSLLNDFSRRMSPKRMTIEQQQQQFKLPIVVTFTIYINFNTNLYAAFAIH